MTRRELHGIGSAAQMRWLIIALAGMGCAVSTQAAYTDASVAVQALGQPAKGDSKFGPNAQTVSVTQSDTYANTPSFGFSSSVQGFASATASLGSVGVSVSGFADAAKPLVGQPGCEGGCIMSGAVYSEVYARFGERLTIYSPEAATLTFATFASGSQVSNVRPGGGADGTLRFEAVVNPASGGVTSVTNRLEGSFLNPVVTDQLVFSSFSVAAGSNLIDLTVTATAVLGVSATAWQVPQEIVFSSASGSMAYLNTFHWAGFHSAKNAAGQDVLGSIRITSETNSFDYLSASSPIPVPEPATWILGLVGLGVVIAAKRTRVGA